MNTQSLNINDLYLRYGPMVFRRCKQLLLGEDTAKDITQNVFIKVWEKRDSLKDEYPSSLLWRITTNLCLNHIRDQKKRNANVQGNELFLRIASSENVEKNLVHRDLLEKLFKRNPESSRTIAVLHLIDGMTLEEVAEEMKMSVSGVRKRLRALKNTLTELEDV